MPGHKLPDLKVPKRSRLRGLILPGATARDRAWACCGAAVGILVTALLSTWVFGRDPAVPLLVAPIGASAVLLFAVPSSPLAQPWPIIGGNTISALVGIAVAHFVHEPVIAAGLAVSLAIAAMSLTRSLHPPGGAAALLAVLGGHAVLDSGFMYALVPVAANSGLLLAMGWLFHRLSGHRYPHPLRQLKAAILPQYPLPPVATAIRSEDLDAALADWGEPLDIDRNDLERLLHRVQYMADKRVSGLGKQSAGG